MVVLGGFTAEQRNGRERTASRRRNLYPTRRVVLPGLMTCKNVSAKSYLKLTV